MKLPVAERYSTAKQFGRAPLVRMAPLMLAVEGLVSAPVYVAGCPVSAPGAFAPL